jgi:superoxide dismutase
MRYVVQEHLKPRGPARLSSESIDAHWALYEGYVRNTNELVEELERARPGSRHWSGLFNWWVSEREIGHPAGLSSILVLDVFEHAWLIDYRIDQKPEYVEAFLANVRWSVVEQRFKDSLSGGIPARF